MLKRILTALLAAAMLLSVTACGKKAPAGPSLKEGVTLQSLVDDIKEEFGVAMPAEVDEDILRDLLGIDPGDVEEYAGYITMVMISADNLIAVKAKADKVETVQKAFTARKEMEIQSFEQYLPTELEKAKDGRILTIGDYVFLVLLGSTEDPSSEMNAVEEKIKSYFDNIT